MKKILFKKSFTLLEVLIYLAIVGVVLSMLMTYALNIVEIGSKSSTIQEVSSTTRYISERFKFLIRNADDIDFSSSDFGVNLVTNPGSKIVLINSSPNTQTIIDVIDGQLRITEPSIDSTPVSLNSNLTKINDLTFNNFSSTDNKTKNIEFRLTVMAAYDSPRQEFQQTISLQSGAELRSN